MADHLIGRYKIEGLLGRGAMGVVYKAYDPILDRYAAIKVMSTSGELDDELRARFFREARSAARLSNPNIIGIYDMGEDKDRPFIAMEYVEGEDLKHLIKQRLFLPFEKKVRLIIQICDALSYAHLHGVIHRDIKPGNIRITRLGEVKILDFGLARLESSEMTRTGMLMGTPYYMSPEQAKGAREIDGRSDLFSVGVILYELLSYRRPFEGETPATVCFQIIREPHAPLSTYLPGCDPELESIIDKALAKEPSDRFDDCGQMGVALNQFVKSLPGRQAALLESIAKVEAEIEAALNEAGIIDRAGLDQIALNEVTMARPVESSASSAEQSTVIGTAERDDYGSLLIRFSAANRQLDALKDNLDKFQAFQEAYRTTRDLFEKGDWQACLGNLEKIEKEFPVTPEMLSMRSVCLKELAKAEAERQKRSEVEAALSGAKAAWKRGNLEACVKACQLVLRIAPDCQEAVELREQAQALLTRGRRARELLDQAVALFKQNQYQKAGDLIEQAVDLDPELKEAIELRQSIEERVRKEQKQRERLHAARASWEAEDYAAARKALQAAIALGGESQEARDLANRIAATEKELQRAARLLSQKKYGDAVEAAGAVLRLQPGQSRALQIQKEAEAALDLNVRIARAREKAAALVASGSHQEAIAVCEEGLTLDSEDEELKRLLEQSRAYLERQSKIQKLLAECEARLSESNWQGAVEAAEAALALDSGSAKARELKRQATEQIERAETLSALRKRARDARAGESWSEAEAVALEGLRLEPNDSELLEIRAQVAAGVQKLKRIASILAEAGQNLKGEKFESAVALADQVLSLDAANREAAAIKQAARRAIDEARKRVEAERQKAIEAARSTARSYLQKGEYSKCVEACDEGLAMAGFDRTLEELRSNADRAIRERSEKLDGALTRGREALAAGRIADALQAAADARDIDPGEQAVAELEQAAGRAQAEIERRTKVEELLAAARQAKEESAAQRCSELTREALGLEPSHVELQELHQWASTVLEAERIERERRAKIAASWKAAQSAIQRRKYRRAVRNLDVVLGLDAENREAARARQEAAEAAVIQRGKRVKLAYYGVAGVLSLSVAVFGILPVVSTNENEPAQVPVQQAPAAVNPQPRIDIPPAPKPSNPKEEPAAEVSRLIEQASKSLKEKDYAGASQLARQVLGMSGSNAEARRIEQAADKSLEEIASGKREVRSLISEGKADEALRRLNVVLQLAPADNEASQLAARLNNLTAAKEVADRAGTDMREAKARARTIAADSPNLLDRAVRIENEAGRLYANSQFGEAAAKFNQAKDAFVSAEQEATNRAQQRRLEAARQPAVQAQQGYDQSRAKALAAGADQFAADLLRQADAKAGEARRKLAANDFSGAQQDFRSAARLAEDAADAASKTQENRRAEKDSRDTALGQARTNAEQVRRRLDTAKGSFGAQDAEAAAEEAKAVSLFEQGVFDQAAAAFERSLKRYQVLAQDHEGVRSVVSAFSRAYSGRDLRALKELWPGIDSETERVFKATFEASQAVELSLRASEIDINQDSAVATGSGRLRVTPINGKPLERESTTVKFQLARNGSSWAIQSYRFSSAAR